MKFLFLNQGPWGTGSFTAVENIAKELVAMGHQVKIFFPDNGLVKESDHYYYSNPNLFHIWHFPIKNDKTEIPAFPLMIPDPHPRNPKGICFSDFGEEQVTLYFDELKKELAEIISSFSPDIIDCGHLHIMAYVVQSFGLSYFVTAHHIDQLSYKRYIRVQSMAKEVARNATAIFAISAFVKKEVEALYEVESEKVVVVQNGYDEEVFRPLNLKRNKTLEQFGLSVPDGAILVTFAGKISRTKGIDLLLKANKLLKRKDIHFVICGSGSIEEAILPEEKGEVLLERVHLMGHLEPKALVQLHSIARFSVLPSRSEGFGIGCLEAMGCGLPVIYTDSGGMPEYAVGKMIPKEDPEELALAIEEFASLPSDRLDQLSKEARKIAISFSWSEVVKERLEVYRKKNGS